MDCRKNWNAYGWTGGFTFAKVMSFTCGWRGAPVKNGRSLCGAWSSAQSLLSCWTNAVHQTQQSQSLTPPAPPVPVPADARQHLALAVLALFFKHNDFKPPHGGFSLATWLGIAATAALSTPIALADCYSPEGPGAHPPAAVLKAWNDLHTADCSSAVLLTLSCAQHCARTSNLCTSYEAPMPSVRITENPPLSAAQSTTTHIPATSHTAQQLAQASSLLPPPEPESFELSNPIWSCHPSHTPTAPKQRDAHQLSLTATEPLGVHVVTLMDSTAPTSSNHSSSAGKHEPSMSTSHASDHVDWPVLPSAACANECQECEPWCALSAAAGQLWKQVEPSVADYCKHAITEYHKCRGDCYHPQQQQQQHQSSSSMPPLCATDEPYATEHHAHGSAASTMHLLDNIANSSDHTTRCRLRNSEVSVGAAHHTHVTTHLGNHSCQGTAGSTRLSSNVIASAKSTPLEVIHEEPVAESATELRLPEPTWQCAMESELDSFPAANTVSNSTHEPGSTEVPACAKTVAASSSQAFDICQLGLSTPTSTEEVTEHFESQIAESSAFAACGEQLSGSGRCEENATHTVLMGSLVRVALHAPQAVDMQLEAMQVHGQGVAAHIEPISIDSSNRSRRCSSSSSSSDGDVLHRAEKRAKLCESVKTDCGVVNGCKSAKTAEAFSQYLAWREQLLGTQGLELTLAVLGVPDLSLTARNEILNAESTLRLDEMPRVLQALEWDMHELQSQASIISEGLDYFRAHPTAGSWEMAEGHLETLDEYFQKARTIVGRMPPCTEASRTQVLQLVVPPLVQCSKVCSAGLATLLSKQAQSATNIRGSDMTEQLELVQRFVHLAVQITQEFRESEIVVPDLDYSQELGHAVRDVNVAFTTSAKRLQTSAIGGLFQAHTARNTAELDRVLAMTKMWKQAHKLSGAIGKVWPDLQGTTLSQLAECQKHAAEAFAKLLRSPQHSQQGQRGKKAANAANAATPQSPPPAAVDEAAWSDKSVSSEEVARLKRVLDLLSSLLHYSKTTYKEVMLRKPQDKADGRRYAAIQQAFFDVALSLAKRSSRWTGPRVRTLQGGVLGELKRCQSEVLRFIVEWDKSCVGVPGHKQMVNLQEITCRLVRQYMALQRQSSRDSLSTPRTRQPEMDAKDMHPYLHLPAANPPGTQSPSLPSTTNNSPFANPTAQSAKTTAAFNAQAINDMSTSHFHLPGMLPSTTHIPTQIPLPCAAGMMPTTSPFAPDGMMPAPAFAGPIAALMSPIAAQTQSVNPFAAAAAYHAYNRTNLSNPHPITPVSNALHTHDPSTPQQQQQQPTSVSIPALNLPNTAQSPFSTPPAQTDPSSNSNSPFNDLALHSRLQSVVESLTPGRSTTTASPAGSTATYLPPISESIPSTTHFSSTHTLITNATHASQSNATCSHTSSHTSTTTCTSIAPASIPTSTSTSAHVVDRNWEEAGNGMLSMYSGAQAVADTMAFPVSVTHTSALPGVLHGSFHANGNGLPAVSPPAVYMGAQAHQLVASPQRAHSVSIIGVRAGMNGSEVVVADASDMFLTKESSRGNGAESLLTATAANVVDDFWGVKWEEVLGANVKEWFTGKTRLGRGSYGEVYKASYYHSDVAVKVLPIRSATVHTVKQEIDVLRSTRHPNVVRFLGACLEPVTPGQSKPTRHLAIVMELCDIGTLHATITKARHLATRKRDARVMHFYSSWPTRLDIARGIAAGTAFLHSRHVVHRDLTSYNVLLHYGLPWQAKVADFGLSRDASGPELNYSGDLHSPGWRAPELLVPNSKYTMKADVYSFGVILWELLTLRQPWEEEFDKAQQAGPRGNLPMFIKNEVVTGARLRFPEPDQVGGDLPEAAQVIHLAERCWHSNPDDRPTMEEVVKKLEKIITQVRRRR